MTKSIAAFNARLGRQDEALEHGYKFHELPAAGDPDAVVPNHQDERPLPLNAAVPLPGSRIGRLGAEGLIAEFMAEHWTSV